MIPVHVDIIKTGKTYIPGLGTEISLTRPYKPWKKGAALQNVRESDVFEPRCRSFLWPGNLTREPWFYTGKT